MSNNFNYSLVSKEDGTYVVRSVVNSFNLDHVTDKDVVAFYNNFSRTASFDTGLLPLDGTGVLAIRTAGSHTQIVTQHAPGLYHINWGSYEGDRTAKTYYVAQPYRIVIGDFKDGNLLGARMFYSPYPVTTPDTPLYHVNLPNINCKGYRGNGVGWICLYHKDDWSELPFNEKVSRFIERCSGVETYNDANMSETDGPRFYQQYNKPAYVIDPHLWQHKSEEEGFGWTLDPNLWIPVLVRGLDDQDRHHEKGIPLTLATAILGNYQAYYTDTDIPKMYNVVSRPDLNLSNSSIADFFKKSFASAPSSYIYTSKDNPYSFTTDYRIKNGSETLQETLPYDEDDDDVYWTCNNCDEQKHEDEEPNNDAYGNAVCSSCLESSYIFIESSSEYYHIEDDNILYSESSSEYYHMNYDSYFMCHSCESVVGIVGTSQKSKEKLDNISYHDQDGEVICMDCFMHDAAHHNLDISECAVCQKSVVISTGWNHVYPTFKSYVSNGETLESKYNTFCVNCASLHFVCPCGLIRNSSDTTFNPCSSTIIEDNDNKTVSVESCCSTCLGAPDINENGSVVCYYTPLNKETAFAYLKDPSTSPEGVYTVIHAQEII